MKRFMSSRLSLALSSFTFALGALVVTGCGYTIDSAPLNSPPRVMHARPASAVDVYTSGRPNIPVHEVAILTAEEQSVYSAGSESGALARLREEAGQMGCDGLVVLGPTSNVSSGIEGDYTRTLRGMRATCIVYDREPSLDQRGVSSR